MLSFTADPISLTFVIFASLLLTFVFFDVVAVRGGILSCATIAGPQGEFINRSYYLKGGYASEGSGKSVVAYTNNK